MERDIEKLEQVLRDNIYMTLATASKRAEPWVTPLCFAYDEHYSIYWKSQKTSLHSQNIYENPSVAVTIFNSALRLADDFPAIYMRSSAGEVNREELDAAITLLDSRMNSFQTFVSVSPEDAFTDFPMKVYKATPLDIYRLKESAVEYRQWVDTRIPIRFR